MVEKFDALLKDIEGATDHIHMQYYIYRSDTLGRNTRCFDPCSQTRSESPCAFGCLGQHPGFTEILR